MTSQRLDLEGMSQTVTQKEDLVRSLEKQNLEMKSCFANEFQKTTDAFNQEKAKAEHQQSKLIQSKVQNLSHRQDDKIQELREMNEALKTEVDQIEKAKNEDQRQHKQTVYEFEARLKKKVTPCLSIDPQKSKISSLKHASLAQHHTEAILLDEDMDIPFTPEVQEVLVSRHEQTPSNKRKKENRVTFASEPQPKTNSTNAKDKSGKKAASVPVKNANAPPANTPTRTLRKNKVKERIHTHPKIENPKRANDSKSKKSSKLDLFDVFAFDE